MGEFMEEATKAGVLLAAGAAGPLDEAIKVRYRDGEFTVLDGPFTEAKELIGGGRCWSTGIRPRPSSGPSDSWPSPVRARSRSGRSDRTVMITVTGWCRSRWGGAIPPIPPCPGRGGMVSSWRDGIGDGGGGARGVLLVGFGGEGVGEGGWWRWGEGRGRGPGPGGPGRRWPRGGWLVPRNREREARRHRPDLRAELDRAAARTWRRTCSGYLPRVIPFSPCPPAWL